MEPLLYGVHTNPVPFVIDNPFGITIPKPIAFTQGISLTESLESYSPSRNVYINSLYLKTNNIRLQQYVSRFRIVESFKVIIDYNTGDCRG